MNKRGLIERIDAEGVICAEGFLFEMERRGYLSAGEFVPEVALEYPDALRQLHRDFQHAGSGIVQAFTYNGHREKMRVIGKEELLEPLNRAALRIAREVAETPPAGREPDLLAGNISNSNIWDPDDPARQREVRAMFEEMAAWSVEEGADLIIGETFYYAGEAFAALEVLADFGLPTVITIAPMAENRMRDGWDIVDTVVELERRGASVVGMNCFRGPATMLPWLRAMRERVEAPLAALPVPYRTTAAEPTFFSLSEAPGCGCPSPHGRAFPTALDPLYLTRYEMRDFYDTAWSLGIRYLGVCCGGAPMHVREAAEAMGHTPPASRFGENMANHFMYGTNERLPEHITGYGDRA